MYTLINKNKNMSNSIEKLSSFPFEDFLKKTDYTENVLNQYQFECCLLTTKDNSIAGTIYTNLVSHSLKRNRFDESKKTVIVICSKDQSTILRYSLDKLRSFNITKKYDILLIDDRSTEDILSISDEFDTSYIRIDNESNKFNYSMINNIAVSYANFFGKTNIVFFNNDMWPKNEHTLDNIVNKHLQKESFVTGCKLIYPSKEQYIELGKPQHLLQEHLDKIYGTIQHGGIYFLPRQSVFVDKKRSYFSENFVLAPLHLWRFHEEQSGMASFDSQCYSVTGALQVVNTHEFIKLNGFNMIMAGAFQDIDLCVRAIKNNLGVWYIGSETMIHAESITNASERITQKPEFLSDNIAWDLTWGLEIPSIIGYQR